MPTDPHKRTHKYVCFFSLSSLPNLNIFSLMDSYAAEFDGFWSSVKKIVSSDSNQKIKRMVQRFVVGLQKTIISLHFEAGQLSMEKLFSMVDFVWVIKNFEGANEISKSCWCFAMESIFKQEIIDFTKNIKFSQEELNQACAVYHRSKCQNEIGDLIISAVMNHQPLFFDGVSVVFRPIKLCFPGKLTFNGAVDSLLNRLINTTSNKGPVDKLRSFLKFATSVEFLSDQYYYQAEFSAQIESRVTNKIDMIVRGLDTQTTIELGLETLRYDPANCYTCNLISVQETVWKKVQKSKDFVFKVNLSRIEELQSEAQVHAWLNKTKLIFGDENKWPEQIYGSEPTCNLLVFVSQLTQKLSKNKPANQVTRAGFENFLKMLEEGELEKKQIDLFVGNDRSQMLTQQVAVLSGVQSAQERANAIYAAIMDYKSTEVQDQREYDAVLSHTELKELIKPFWGSYKPNTTFSIKRIRMFKQMRDCLKQYIPIVISGNFFKGFYEFINKDIGKTELNSFAHIKLKVDKCFQDFSQMSTKPSSSLFDEYSKWIFNFESTELEQNLSKIYLNVNCKELLEKILVSYFVRGVSKVDLKTLLDQLHQEVTNIFQVAPLPAGVVEQISALQSKTELAASDINSIPVDILEFMKFISSKGLSEVLIKIIQASQLLFNKEFQNLDADSLSRLTSDMDLATLQNLGSALPNLSRLIEVVQRAISTKPTSIFGLLMQLLHTESTQSLRDRVRYLD